MNKGFIGVLLVLFYCIVSAASFVLVGQYEQSFHPFKLVFYTFILAQIFFSCFTWRQTISLIKKSPSSVWRINVATAISWMAVFYSLKYLNPSVVMGIIYAAIPIGSVGISLYRSHFDRGNRADIFFSILLGLGIVLLMVYSIFTTSPSQDKFKVYLSLALAVVNGLTLSFAILYMKSLHNDGYSAIQTMSIRFWLTIIASCLFVLFTGQDFSIDFTQFIYILIIAFSSTIIPVYFFQKGLERITPITASFIIPLQPVITYFIQFFAGEFKSSLILFLLILLLSSLILISALYKGYKAL